MRNRISKLGAGIAAIAVLAFGGAALASAAQNSHPTPPAPQPAEVQATDGDNVQQGDQAAADTASSAEQASEGAGDAESASSESGPGDGPGGYADTSPNADTQQQGEH